MKHLNLQADISETKRNLGKNLYKSCRFSWGKYGNNILYMERYQDQVKVKYEFCK